MTYTGDPHISRNKHHQLGLKWTERKKQKTVGLPAFHRAGNGYRCSAAHAGCFMTKKGLLQVRASQPEAGATEPLRRTPEVRRTQLSCT